MVRLALLVALALVAPSARGEGGDPEERARVHFQAGEALYKLGNYKDAVREFSAGYDLSPRPEFLLDLGQAYRQLHEDRQALAMFRRFVDEAAPSDPRRLEVALLTAELEKQLDVRPVEPVAQPAPAPPSPAPVEKSHVRGGAWVVVLIGVVALVAGAVALGVALASSGGPPATTLGVYPVGQ
jgi:tetratricopeptide (TPR) repeat protein